MSSTLSRWAVLAAPLFVGLLGWAGSARAAPETPEELDAKLEAEIGAIDPALRETFAEANRVRDTDRARAALLYGEVARAAPSFTAARRRECHALSATGRPDEALAACRDAATRDPSGKNLGALAIVLVRTEKDLPAPERLAEARAVAARAVEVAPEDPFAREARCRVLLAAREIDPAIRCVEALERDLTAEERAGLWMSIAQVAAEKQGAPTVPGSSHARAAVRRARDAAPEKLRGTVERVACTVALRTEDNAALAECSDRIRQLEPEAPAGFVFGAIAAAQQGKLEDARAHLETAHAKGLPDEQYRHLRGAIDESEAPLWRHLRVARNVGAIWALAFAALFGAGALLSRLTLSGASRPVVSAESPASPADRRLRRAYAIVLWLSCALYYVSLPLVLVAVVAAGAGVVFAFLAIGHIPVKLVLIVVICVAVTAWAMLKSLLVRTASEDPGQRVELEAHPRFSAVLREVAERVGTRPVDTVFLTPGTDLAVFERGGLSQQLRGTAERCLVLGAGVLPGMSTSSFKAILAHEYGHLSNRDTAGGGFALAVRRSLMSMALGLVQGGAAAWYNPAWLFFQGFFRVFLRISQGASRLQEILADRWSAATYGPAAFEAGLRHVIARSVRFDAHVNATLSEVLEGPRRLRNLYAYRPAKPLDESSIEAEVEKAINAEPSPYDSHPSPRDRFELVRRMPAVEGEDDASDAFTLFDDPENIEVRMTALVRERAAEGGILIEDDEPSSRAA
jgi:Zn-dependent protease with chaperone function